MPQRSSSIFFKLSSFLCVALVLGILGRFLVFSFLPANEGDSKAVVLEIRRGQNPNDITHQLTSNGIVSNPKLFLWLGRVTRKWSHIKTGEYRFSPAMSPYQVLKTLTSGISLAHRITIREGENSYEIADALAEAGLAKREDVLKLVHDPAFIRSFANFGMMFPESLEGYLYPDTYFFNRTQTPEDMIKQMVHHFFDHWGMKEETAAAKLGMTRHQVTTLASIIEKETGVARERPIISGVFHNRLKIKMRLQSDPTIIYGIWETYDGNIRRRDFSTANPYNTYHVSALPVGPIANPGSESIQAALHPVQSQYLYFVSHNDGTHEFSKSLDEHNRAVKKFQLDPKARVGKSWRDQSRSHQTSSQ